MWFPKIFEYPKISPNNQIFEHIILIHVYIYDPIFYAFLYNDTYGTFLEYVLVNICTN